MPFGASAKTIVSLFPAGTTVSGTNNDSYGTVQKAGFHKGIEIFVPRTADTGTTTADVYLQGLRPNGTETNDTHWFDVTGKVIVTYADGETGTYIGVVYPGITSVTGGVDPVSTATGAKVQHANGYLPDIFRIRIRNGGTTVTNTFSEITGVLLP